MSYATAAMSEMRTALARQARFQIYPSAGLAATVVGTLVAIALVPDDPFAEGALRLSGVAMAIGLLAAPAISVLRQPMAALRAENLIMVGLCYWILLDPIQGHYNLVRVGREGIYAAFVAVGVFAAGAWFAAMQRPWPLPDALERAARMKVKSSLIFSVIAFSFTLFIYRHLYPCDFDIALMVHSLFQPRFAAPWSRGGAGGWDAFLDHLTYFGLLIPPLTVCLIRLRGWVNSAAVMSIFFSIVIIMFVAQGGNRRVIGQMIGACLMVWLAFKDRIDSKTIGALALMLVLSLVFMQMMLLMRNSGWRLLFQPELLTESAEAQEITSSVRVDDNFLRMAQVLEIFPHNHEFLRGNFLFYVAVRPIPRVFWPGKPLSPGFSLSGHLGYKNVALTTSIVGEWYMVYGWPAVLLGGWLHGCMGRMFSRLLTDSPNMSRSLVYAVSAMIVIAGLRSMIEVVLASYVLLGWIFVSRFMLGGHAAPAFETRPHAA